MRRSLFDEAELSFITTLGKSTYGKRLVGIFRKIINELNDARSIPVPKDTEDAERALGRALLARRLAAGIIESEVIELLEKAGSMKEAPEQESFR